MVHFPHHQVSKYERFFFNITSYAHLIEKKVNYKTVIFGLCDPKMISMKINVLETQLN